METTYYMAIKVLLRRTDHIFEMRFLLMRALLLFGLKIFLS